MVAVKRTTRVSDLAAHAFTRAFYLALAVGQTIRGAFDIGVQAVVTSPTLTLNSTPNPNPNPTRTLPLSPPLTLTLTTGQARLWTRPTPMSRACG